MPRLYPFRPVIDNRYYLAIGRAIVMWGFLEDEIDSHIMMLLAREGSPKLNDGFPRSFEKKKKLWRKLVKIHFVDEDRDRMNDIIDRAVTARRERDKFAHGVFTKGPKGQISLRTQRPETSAIEHPVSVEAIRRNAQHSSQLIGELIDLWRGRGPQTRSS